MTEPSSKADRTNKNPRTKVPRPATTTRADLDIDQRDIYIVNGKNPRIKVPQSATTTRAVLDIDQRDIVKNPRIKVPRAIGSRLKAAAQTGPRTHWPNPGFFRCPKCHRGVIRPMAKMAPREGAMCKREGRCYRCGEEGHLGINCDIT
jgi:hypothetical protein